MKFRIDKEILKPEYDGKGVLIFRQEAWDEICIKYHKLLTSLYFKDGAKYMVDQPRKVEAGIINNPRDIWSFEDFKKEMVFILFYDDEKDSVYEKWIKSRATHFKNQINWTINDKVKKLLNTQSLRECSYSALDTSIASNQRTPEDDYVSKEFVVGARIWCCKDEIDEKLYDFIANDRPMSEIAIEMKMNRSPLDRRLTKIRERADQYIGKSGCSYPRRNK